MLSDEVCLYYPNGQLKHRASKSHGLLEGAAIFYTEDGRVLSEVFYKADQMEGEARFYYTNGQLFSRQHFQKGHWEGVQEFFNREGKMKTQLVYSEGKLQKAILD